MSNPTNPDFESKHERGRGGKFVRMEREETEISGLGDDAEFEPVSRYEFREGDRVKRLPQVGEHVRYFDIANQNGPVHEVIGHAPVTVPQHNGREVEWVEVPGMKQAVLRNTETGETTESLIGNGWRYMTRDDEPMPQFQPIGKDEFPATDDGKVHGEAEVGDYVRYSDMSNQDGEVWQVTASRPQQTILGSQGGKVITADHPFRKEYTLVSAQTGEMKTSDLAQNGWGRTHLKTEDEKFRDRVWKAQDEAAANYMDPDKALDAYSGVNADLHDSLAKSIREECPDAESFVMHQSRSSDPYITGVKMKDGSVVMADSENQMFKKYGEKSSWTPWTARQPKNYTGPDSFEVPVDRAPEQR